MQEPTPRTIKTDFDTIQEIREVVADYFINHINEEEVFVQNRDEDEELFDIYNPMIVKAINTELQVLHFGGTLQ